jgi:hypothetical protein
MIPNWSFSKLSTFEQCKHRAYLLYDQKIPEPQRPLPPGKTEHANDRGSRIHDAAEHFVDGTGPFIREMSAFLPEFEKLRKLYAAGMVSLEGEWGMNKQWEPDEWKKAWLRLKLDALVFLSETEAVAIDYKTGRKFGNEVKHSEQLQLYQLNTFLRYPKLEIVHTELWYLDQDEITTMTYLRHQGLRFKQKWDMRGTALTTCTDFPANPNVFSCKWCMYGAKGSKVCERGL